MTKAQGRRHNKKAGKYKDQAFRTKANKARRALKREKIAKNPKTLERKVIRLARAESKYIINLSKKGINKA